MAGRGPYAESLLRWRNYPYQAVLEDVNINPRRLNLKRTKMFGRLKDEVPLVRRKLLHENKENIFDNFDSRNFSVIALESPKRIETNRKGKCVRPILYPRSSSRKALKDSPATDVREGGYDNQMDSHSLDTSCVLSEDKQTISCSDGHDIISNQRGGTMIGQRPSTLGASNASIVTTDSCYFSPISPLSEPRCKNISIIEKIESVDNKSVEDITNVSSISDGSINSVHEQVSATRINDEAVFCSTFRYPLHSTVLNTPPDGHITKKSDDFNMTTLVDSSAVSYASDEDSCEEEGASCESNSPSPSSLFVCEPNSPSRSSLFVCEPNSPSPSSLFVCIKEETGSSCELMSLTRSPLSVCIEEMEQVDLSTSLNNGPPVKRLLRTSLTSTGRCDPIGREKAKNVLPRTSVLGRTYSSKTSGVGMIGLKYPQGILVPNQALIDTGRNGCAVSERLPTEGRSIVLDNCFRGRRLKRQIGNTELIRHRLIEPGTSGRVSSPKIKIAVNESTIASIDSSRSTLFASRVRASGRDAYLQDEYTEVSIDIDLPGSALFSKENSPVIDNVSSSDTSTKIKHIFRPKLSNKISVITEGSIIEGTETIAVDTFAEKNDCNKRSSKLKYQPNQKNNPSVRSHSLYCSENLVEARTDRTSHMPNYHRLVKKVVAKPNENEVHKCLAVDSMQLGRRKFSARKFQHLRRALRSDGYTRMTTMGQL